MGVFNSSLWLIREECMENRIVTFDNTKTKEEDDIYINELKRLFPRKKNSNIAYIIHFHKESDGDAIYLFFSKLGLLIKEGEYGNYTNTHFFDIAYGKDNAMYINCAYWSLILSNQRRLNESHTFEQFRKTIRKSKLLNEFFKEAESQVLKNQLLKEEYSKFGWLTRPVHGSLQAEYHKNYFKHLFSWYKKTQKDFCNFLVDINYLLKQENNNDYLNLIMFLEGNPNVDWISYKGSLFDVFSRMFENKKTPLMTVEYIKECNAIHKAIINSNYKLSDEYIISNKISAWDGRIKTFITCQFKPTKPVFNYDFFFEISSGSLIIDDKNSDITASKDISIEVKSKEDIIDDSLSLFECSSNNPFYKKLFWDAIEQLALIPCMNRGIYHSFAHGTEQSFNNVWPVVGKHKIKEE